MRRDMELVRQILLRVRQAEGDLDSEAIRVDGFSPSQVGRHCKWMAQAGLLEVVDRRNLASTYPVYCVLDLTWEGHDLAELLLDEERWRKTRSVLKTAGSWAMGSLTQAASQLAMRAVSAALG